MSLDCQLLRRGRRGRPQVIEARTERLTVRFTRTERAALTDLTEGGSLADYVRRAALGRRGGGRVQVPAINAQAWQELARAASNLNQLAHATNAGRVLRADDIAPVIRQLRDDIPTLRRQLVGLRNAGEDR